MKVCPVCKSRCFDDMDTCYGCMYRFDTRKSEAQQGSKYASSAYSSEVSEYARSGPAREVSDYAASAPTREVSEYARSGSFSDAKQNETAGVNQQVMEHEDPARWVQVPAAKVELPPKPNAVPNFHEVEDNVNRYIMLEDVEQFLSRRLVEDDSSIVMEHSQHCQANFADVDKPKFEESLSLQSQNLPERNTPKGAKRTLTLTLEIPQEAMSMLVC